MTLEERFFSKTTPEPNTGCLLWTGSTTDKGYGRFHRGRRNEVRKAPRVAWEISHGQIPEGLHVLHRCDTPPCVEVRHLFLGTNSQNMLDMLRKGRQARGEQFSHAKLTEEAVIAIRASNRSQRDMAIQFGVSTSLISLVRRREKWKHVIQPVELMRMLR